MPPQRTSDGARGRPFVRVWAPAKINLGLEVLGRRDDGYHDLITLFQAVHLGDTLDLRLREQPGVDLRVRSEIARGFSGATSPLELGPVESNLVVRAAKRLLPSEGRWRGVEASLVKRIPVGAGLGGGSADAAATLLGLSELLKPGLPKPGLPKPDPRSPGTLKRDGSRAPADLQEIALSLGADVPFPLVGGTKLGEGVGERLRPFPEMPRRRIVLVWPNVFLSTSSVFRALSSPLTPQGPLARMAELEIPRGFWGGDWFSLRNDLQPGVEAVCPPVRSVLESFEQLGSTFTRMTGSGSSVFGLARSGSEADHWVNRFRSQGFWARAVFPFRGGCRVRQIERGRRAD